MMHSEAIKIDIVSDVACPWCYIGKKHLEAALAEPLQGQGRPVEITWHPFQLDPTIPEEGIERDAYFVKKFGSIDRIDEMFQRVAGVGEVAGIDFNFDKISKVVNTMPFHQLLHVAREEGIQNDLKEQFFKANFTDGVDFSEKKAFLSLMETFGWSHEKTASILADETIKTAVNQETAHFQQMGVTGVPFFIFNNKYAFSGAQPTSVFIETINKMAAEMPPATADDLASGESCDATGDNC